MISKKLYPLTQNNSAIRAMFEEGARLSKLYGPENVYDFSIGNPSVAPPKEVNEAIAAVVAEESPMVLHGYMSNSGFEDVRDVIAASLNKRFGTELTGGSILMTVGAAGGMNVILQTLLDPGDEVIAFAPFFVEYKNYVGNYDGVLVPVSPNPPSFQPKLDEFEAKINKKTKAVIINTPNNPTGVIYSADTLKKLAEILERKQRELGTSIYIISDEPYRELAYDGAQVPYIPAIYKNTIVGYSFSKSLSLPGERIGYLVLPPQMDDAELITAAAAISNRILGYVNAPSLFQKVVGRCIECKCDVDAYDRNRRLLYDGLTACGFDCTKPQGAFYLWLKTPIDDDKEFCQAAKKYNLLLVPGSSFFGPGYVRIAYCVSPEKIQNAMPAFKKLAQEYGLC